MDFIPFDDEELPPLVDSETNVPILNNSGRTIAMPSECTTNPLQRALADSIIRMVSLDELRILFACGAKVSELRWSRSFDDLETSRGTKSRARLRVSGQRTSHSRTLCSSLRCLAKEHRGN